MHRVSTHNQVSQILPDSNLLLLTGVNSLCKIVGIYPTTLRIIHLISSLKKQNKKTNKTKKKQQKRKYLETLNIQTMVYNSWDS